MNSRQEREQDKETVHRETRRARAHSEKDTDSNSVRKTETVECVIFSP